MSVEPTTRPDTDLSASLSTTASAAISDFHTQLSGTWTWPSDPPPPLP